MAPIFEEISFAGESPEFPLDLVRPDLPQVRAVAIVDGIPTELFPKKSGFVMVPYTKVAGKSPQEIEEKLSSLKDALLGLAAALGTKSPKWKTTAQIFSSQGNFEIDDRADSFVMTSKKPVVDEEGDGIIFEVGLAILNVDKVVRI